MILPLYLVGVSGAFLQVAGAQWDVSAHIPGIVEIFFTPAHTLHESLPQFFRIPITPALFLGLELRASEAQGFVDDR